MVFSVFGVFRALKTFVRIYCFGQGTLRTRHAFVPTISMPVILCVAVKDCIAVRFRAPIKDAPTCCVLSGRCKISPSIGGGELMFCRAHPLWVPWCHRSVIKKQTVVFSVFRRVPCLKTFVRICLFWTRHASDKARLVPTAIKGTSTMVEQKKAPLAGALKCCAKRRQFEGLCLFL